MALLSLWKEIQLFGNTASGVSTSLSSLKTVTLTPSDSILFLSNSNSSIALIFISPLDKLEINPYYPRFKSHQLNLLDLGDKLEVFF